MVMLKLIPFLGPLLGFSIVWFLVRHPNPEARRKRAEIILVLAPFVVAVLLFVFYLVSR